MLKLSSVAVVTAGIALSLFGTASPAAAASCETTAIQPIASAGSVAARSWWKCSAAPSENASIHVDLQRGHWWGWETVVRTVHERSGSFDEPFWSGSFNCAGTGNYEYRTMIFGHVGEDLALTKTSDSLQFNC
ncbi:hypothetical protein ACOZFM_28605 [Streptomyces arboris]|uniref:hypothetical protein n=1 Tax=Streptomyces arboris TaxID=2600619 RepID=UPI003BF4B802